jgi:hypothetical protein
MQGYFAALAIVLLLIPPFALFYFYTVFAAPARETLSLARAFSSESLPRT